MLPFPLVLRVQTVCEITRLLLMIVLIFLLTGFLLRRLFGAGGYKNFGCDHTCKAENAEDNQQDFFHIIFLQYLSFS